MWPSGLGWDGAEAGGRHDGRRRFLPVHLESASAALDAGLCDVALVCYGSNQRSAGGRSSSMPDPQPYETPYRARYPASSLCASGSPPHARIRNTRENLADVAVAARNWARLNPDAFERGPLAREEILASRMISDPLTRADCCLVTDGGAAVVLTRADRARDLAAPPAYVLGTGIAVSHRQIASMPDLTTTAAVRSGRAAYDMAGIGPSDIDHVMVYDAFTITTLMFLEDLGFCAKGEGGAFVSSARSHRAAACRSTQTAADCRAITPACTACSR